MFKTTLKKIILNPVVSFQKSSVPSQGGGVQFQKNLLLELGIITEI